MKNSITYKPFGKQAILIEWGPKIASEILKDIIEFKARITNAKTDVIEDIIIGYNSVVIRYRREVSNFSDEVKQLKELYHSTISKGTIENYIWEIPVCYDLEFGIDLPVISESKNSTIEEIIKQHTARMYTVYFIGFLPGFLYLGGLSEQLHFKRKANPRLHVAKGSVAIGGQQTGVYPSDSAGGWNIIGRTPIPFFEVSKVNPCFAKSGDQIKFIAVSLATFYKIENEIKKNTYQLQKEIIND